MTTDESPVQRLSAVALALETVAAAAAAADADELRACEERLRQAVGAMPTPDDFVGVSRTATRAQLQRITFALARCRAIGRATHELIATTLAAQGKAPGYLPQGVGAPAPRIAGSVEVRA